MIGVYGLALMLGVVVGVAVGRAPTKTSKVREEIQTTVRDPIVGNVRFRWTESREGDLTVEVLTAGAFPVSWQSVEIWTYGLTASGHRIGDKPLILAFGQKRNGIGAIHKVLVGRNRTQTPVKKLLISSMTIRDESHASQFGEADIKAITELSDSVGLCPEAMGSTRDVRHSSRTMMMD